MYVLSTPLGRYRVEGPVGVGPDGPVQRATPERLGARPVALRRLDVAAGAPRARLRRDAEIIASLGHPALAVVTDVLDIDDHTVLVAAELGTHSLEERLRRDPLPVDEAVAVLRAVGEALAAAHGAGMVHGHLTARNVVFTSDGPLLTDLAQSAAVGRTASPDDDVAALLRLAGQLVADTDRSRRAGAYRAICRWAREPDAGLPGLLTALMRLDEVTAPAGPEAAPATLDTDAPDIGRASAHVGLAVAGSLTLGAVLGAAGTLLPALAG